MIDTEGNTLNDEWRDDAEAQKLVDAIHDHVPMKVTVRFEASEALYEGEVVARDQPSNVELGPFEWVQVTYEWLRCAPIGEDIAVWSDGVWKIIGNHPVIEAAANLGGNKLDPKMVDTNGLLFSDFVIAPAKED